MALRPQKINHFNGMLEICRKKSMARNLQKLQKRFPDHYDFFPVTFILPNDVNVGGPLLPAVCMHIQNFANGLVHLCAVSAGLCQLAMT